MKNGKELVNNDFENYSVVFGTVNNKNPKSVYISISAWGEPIMTDAELSYDRQIKNLNKNIKQNLFDFLKLKNNTPFLKDRSIVDLDMRESGVKIGKRSFMNTEISLFLKEEIPVNSDYMMQQINEIIKELINNSLDKNKNFNFYRRKN